tara:strand:- start:344 stop:670 length:327 start_codon:yes stop_codon:yes gene_type:complete
MSDQKSTMSPKRLFIILCIAGFLMWFFSNSKVEVEVVVEPGIENTEMEFKENDTLKSVNVKKINRKRSKKKNKVLTEENSEYIPQSLRINFKKEEIKNDYIPQSQRED